MPDMSSFESLKSIGTSPVTGDEFEHETELPGYSDIADEIARLDFDGVRAVNWEIVVRKSEIILRDHSKNLRIAIYMTYGLYETNGLPGFAAGLGQSLKSLVGGEVSFYGALAFKMFMAGFVKIGMGFGFEMKPQLMFTKYDLNSTLSI